MEGQTLREEANKKQNSTNTKQNCNIFSVGRQNETNTFPLGYFSYPVLCGIGGGHDIFPGKEAGVSVVEVEGVWHFSA